MRVCHVGEKMPSLVKHCTMTSMVAYAGATWDWHRIHYENEYVKARGIDYPVVDGQVFGAYAVQAIQDWLGSKAFVSSLDFRLSQLVYANEIVRGDGEITKVSDEGLSIEMKVTVIDSTGNIIRVVVEPMSAIVLWQD